MTPLRTALILAVVLGGLVAAVLEIDTDIRGLLGASDRVTSQLDTPEGLALTLAIIDPDADKRTSLASEIAAELSEHPLVHRVTTIPEAPSAEMLDWLWRHRFLLAPPSRPAFTPEGLASEMHRARAALVSASGGAFADRYLLDPTGSFRRLVTALSRASDAALPVHRAIAQARDGSAALIFIELANRPFNVALQTEFDAELRQRVKSGGMEALLIGPRAISAEISGQIAAHTAVTASIAIGLLLLWLAYMLRPIRAMLVCLLPALLGFGTAALLLQLGFGSVHVLALGFGGALLGLALDYPLHLLAHRENAGQSARARRYVALGAATTAIAFLALLGSGIPAIGQVGLFVACGLVVAATCAIWLVSGSGPVSLKSVVPVARPRILAHKLLVLAAVALVCAAVLWQSPNRAAQRLVDVPPRVISSIKQLSTMIDLPSGRYHIDVTGATLTEVLARQARLAATLQNAQGEGQLSRFEMLGNYLPERPTAPDLPSPETLSAMLPGPMTEAGFDPGFQGAITAAYQEARDTPPIEPDTLRQFERILAVPGLIRADGDILRASVRLWDVTAPQQLAQAIADLGEDGITFMDQKKSLLAGLDEVSARVSLWLAVGAIAGLLFLLLAVRRLSAVSEIALGCLAAGLLTAVLAGILSGGVGVFQIVALTLVIGIGIDYGIFLMLSESDEQYSAAMRSVLLCAATTLIAFLTMVFSGVAVLEDIGLTVSIGVVAMVGVNLVRRTVTPRSAGK